MKSQTIHWIAGLIEGEGCFFIHKKRPALRLQMCDEDIIARARDILSLEHHIVIYNPPTGKPAYSFTINGNKAIQWMMTLYSLMGRRRKEKIREIIQYWKINTLRKEQGTNICVNGHILTKENKDSFGYCIICRNERARKYGRKYYTPLKQLIRNGKKIGMSKEQILEIIERYKTQVN